MSPSSPVRWTGLRATCSQHAADLRSAGLAQTQMNHSPSPRRASRVKAKDTFFDPVVGGTSAGGQEQRVVVPEVARKLECARLVRGGISTTLNEELTRLCGAERSHRPGTGASSASRPRPSTPLTASPSFQARQFATARELEDAILRIAPFSDSLRRTLPSTIRPVPLPRDVQSALTAFIESILSSTYPYSNGGPQAFKSLPPATQARYIGLLERLLDRKSVV